MIPDDPQSTSPLRVLFPVYWQMDSWVRGELEGMSDAALDWESQAWGFAGWSARRQASHMASLVYRWLAVRWAPQIFPGGAPVTDAELAAIDSPDYDRRMDETVYWDLGKILSRVDAAVDMARSVLSRVTIEEARAMHVRRGGSDQWGLMATAHPRGVSFADDGTPTMLDLEATFRHMYFEYVTHLYNVQRMKRALGLDAVVRLPGEGYWALDDWDHTEAPFGSAAGEIGT
jgi:hypothetical protein